VPDAECVSRPGRATVGGSDFAGDGVAGAGDGLPPALKARLFAAVDLIILWNKTDGQATVTATITDATLAALPAILDPTRTATTTPTTPTTLDH
jgi:hypothetical protein